MDAFIPPKVDPEGYLKDVTDWSPAVAYHLANQAGLQLTDAHWQIIKLLQQYYQEFDHAPAMRPLLKYLNLKLTETVDSIYLLQLFPGSPAKLAAKIAGLPKPKNCL